MNSGVVLHVDVEVGPPGSTGESQSVLLMGHVVGVFLEANAGISGLDEVFPLVVVFVDVERSVLELLGMNVGRCQHEMIGIPNEGTTIPKAVMDLLHEQLDGMGHILQACHLEMELVREDGAVIVMLGLSWEFERHLDAIRPGTELIHRLPPALTLYPPLQYNDLILNDLIAGQYLGPLGFDLPHDAPVGVELLQLGELIRFQILEGIVVASETLDFET
mmetsp:Transcript_31278/g.69265  ORF Transcript_31278/g.69265 Transcript_31278/m.69265 type:complete len:219 (-) Transcript_31278:1490-2146(-)